jgi:hypothetical protein
MNNDRVQYDRYLERIVFLLCICAIWIATHKYNGLIHDSLHYSVLAQYLSGKSAFVTDLMFINGHETYSIFPHVFRLLENLFGASGADRTMVLAGQVLWLSSLLVLTNALFDVRWKALASALSAIVLFHDYGHFGGVSYSETIATPRLFGEALTLLALAMLLKRRLIPMLGVLTLAVIIHPLMSFAGVLLIIYMLFGNSLKTAAIFGLGLAATAVFALLDVGPFGKLLEQYDPEWLNILRTHFSQSFFANWGWKSIAIAALPTVSLILISVADKEPRRKLARYLLSVMVLLVLASWIGGDLMANVLAMNLNLWRGLWLLGVFGNLFAIQAVLIMPKGSLSRLCMAATFFSAIVEANYLSVPLVNAPLAVVTLGIFFAERRSGFVPSLPVKITAWSILAFGSLTMIAAVAVRWSTSETMSQFFDGFVTLSIIALGTAVLLNFRDMMSVKRSRQVTLAACAVVVIWSLTVLDSRNDWERFVENGEPLDQDVVQIFSGKQVYWERGLPLLWVKLGQPSYYSCIQAAPIAFDRKVALEFDRRAQVLSTLNTIDFRSDREGYCSRRANPDEYGPQSSIQLVSVCKALPELDLMVLHDDVPGVTKKTWKPEVPFIYFRKEKQIPDSVEYEMVRIDEFYVYDCAALREL